MTKFALARISSRLVSPCLVVLSRHGCDWGLCMAMAMGTKSRFWTYVLLGLAGVGFRHVDGLASKEGKKKKNEEKTGREQNNWRGEDTTTRAQFVACKSARSSPVPPAAVLLRRMCGGKLCRRGFCSSCPLAANEQAKTCNRRKVSMHWSKYIYPAV